MQNEQIQEESYISFMSILRVGFGRKIIFFAVAIVIALASFFAMHYGYTDSRITYSSSFSYDVKAIQDNKYIDGSNFVVNSIISEDNLNAIKASKEDYARTRL